MPIEQSDSDFNRASDGFTSKNLIEEYDTGGPKNESNFIFNHLNLAQVDEQEEKPNAEEHGTLSSGAMLSANNMGIYSEA